jgi:hypothetical protein
MVMAAAGGNASEEVMKFASNLTIDNEEYAQFSHETPRIAQVSKLPVHASTQDRATAENYEAAADRNNFDMLALFGKGMETTPPGQ